jgi:hypothetical protein
MVPCQPSCLSRWRRAQLRRVASAGNRVQGLKLARQQEIIEAQVGRD